MVLMLQLSRGALERRLEAWTVVVEWRRTTADTAERIVWDVFKRSFIVRCLIFQLLQDLVWVSEVLASFVVWSEIDVRLVQQQWFL